jgi:hypothetical protein
MLTYRLKAPRSFPGTTTTNTIMIPPRLTRPQQVTTAESSRTTVRPPGAGLLTWHPSQGRLVPQAAPAAVTKVVAIQAKSPHPDLATKALTLGR